MICFIFKISKCRKHHLFLSSILKLLLTSCDFIWLISHTFLHCLLEFSAISFVTSSPPYTLISRRDLLHFFFIITCMIKNQVSLGMFLCGNMVPPITDTVVIQVKVDEPFSIVIYIVTIMLPHDIFTVATSPPRLWH